MKPTPEQIARMDTAAIIADARRDENGNRLWDTTWMVHRNGKIVERRPGHPPKVIKEADANRRKW